MVDISEGGAMLKVRFKAAFLRDCPGNPLPLARKGVFYGKKLKNITIKYD
jgi:hypothetical protein